MKVTRILQNTSLRNHKVLRDNNSQLDGRVAPSQLKIADYVSSN